MARPEQHTGPAKLILAFDIGTTFSGVSYCILQQGQVPEVFAVTFPGQPLVDDDTKVPSLLYYDRNGDLRAAGAEAFSEGIIDTALREDWMRVESWRLYFRPECLGASSIDVIRDLPPLPLGKSSVDILADFIEYLFLRAKAYITECSSVFPWTFLEDSIEFIFTLPTTRESIREAYLEAIERADLMPQTVDGPSRVYTLTEGEAALWYYVASSLIPEAVDQTNPRGILVINADVATVDLRMFSIVIEPISLREIAPAFITRRAKGRWLLPTSYLPIDERARPNTGKHVGWESPCEIVETTDQLDSLGSGLDTPSMFSEITDAIISASEKQEKYVTIPITAVVLVGELLTDTSVLSLLRSYFSHRNINIHYPDNYSHTAVANGGVLARTNQMVIDEAACLVRDDDRFSLVCVLPVEENDKEQVHKKCQWGIDPVYYLPRSLESDLCQVVFRQSFSLTANDPKDVGMQTMRIEHLRGQLSDVDRDQSRFSTLCTVSADLRVAVDDLIAKRTASGEVYYHLDYEVIVLFGLSALQAQVGWKTKGGERR